MDVVEYKFRNFRDMGGLNCNNGMHIKFNMLFRTPELSANTKDEIAFLNKIDVDYVIDFRTKEEIKQKPDYKFLNSQYISCPMYDGKKYKYIIVSNKSKIRVLLLGNKNSYKLKKNKIDSYAEMPFSKALNILFGLMDEGKKIAFHCTEGKDRTGVAAAIIEYCLGRNKEQILEEYLLSNYYRPPKDRTWLKKFGYSDETISYMSYCEHTQTELFNVSVDNILSKYGNIDNYLFSCFHISNERKSKWKSYYLEKDSASN